MCVAVNIRNITKDVGEIPMSFGCFDLLEELNFILFLIFSSLIGGCIC